MGDYNRNGIVDTVDFTIWRNTKFMEGPDLWADGNGDGKVTVADYAIWKWNFGMTVSGVGSGSATPVSAFLPGDINRDGTVDLLDRALWASAYGSTTNSEADLNYNGIVDLADLEVWQDMQGATLLESLIELGDLNNDLIIDSRDLALASDANETALVTANFGLVRADVFPDVEHGTNGKPLNLQFAAPVVLGVSVGPTNLTAATGTGEQLRSVAAVNPNSVSITFSEEVLVMLDAFQLTNLDGTSPGTPSVFQYDLATQTATWTYTSPLTDGRYVLRLSDAIFDLGHEALDGDFFNPISLSDAGSAKLPSGDGDAGGEFRFRFTVLAGDTDHNNIHGATNYTGWQSTEPGMIIVSTTADDFDANLAFGDVSLREAIDYANNASGPTAIQLPAGRYGLTRSGTEGSGTANNDLDILGDVAILGAGPGLSVITPGSGFSPPYGDNRIFDVRGAAARLRLQGLTVANEMTYDQLLGAAALVQDQATLEIVDSAIVNNIGYGNGGAAVHSLGSHVTILRSVFTRNQGVDVGSVLATTQGSYNGSLTIGETIFALNVDSQGGYGSTSNVKATAGVVKTNLGNNLFDEAIGGFFDALPAAGDYQGTPHYVVTTIGDTFDHTNDAESLSVREAVDLANQASGLKTIWIPAWRFTLTRDRGANATDTNVSFGDLDIKKSLVVRGVADRTSIAWKTGVNDKVFELSGDFDGDGDVDPTSPLDDWTVWDNEYGSTGAWEQYAGDGDDDGDVDMYDEDVWAQNLGHTLQIFNVA